MINVLTRRCGCGRVFALIHLRDRSQQCTACQRKEGAQFELEEAVRMVHGKAAKECLRRAMEQLEKRRILERADKARQAMRLCEGDFEQVGQCEMPAPSKWSGIVTGLIAGWEPHP